ncbi:hypothetical protein QQP08_015144 [Theobroma cacao]|nr:hypothetical protein QQP08_015144 [Theobroma cacao]
MVLLEQFRNHTRSKLGSMMDNQSSLEFDSDESDLDVRAEEHGQMEDVLQKNLDFCGHNHKLMSPNKVPLRESGKHLVGEDEKDKRIRELSLELYNERQKCKRRCAAYEEQLNLILKDLENHTAHISKTVADMVQSIKEIEEEQSVSDGVG